MSIVELSKISQATVPGTVIDLSSSNNIFIDMNITGNSYTLTNLTENGHYTILVKSNGSNSISFASVIFPLNEAARPSALNSIDIYEFRVHAGIVYGTSSPGSSNRKFRQFEAWITNYNYLVGDIVEAYGYTHRCVSNHTSSNISILKDLNKWITISYSVAKMEHFLLAFDTTPDPLHLLCDGSSYDRVDYPRLFEAICPKSTITLTLGVNTLIYWPNHRLKNRATVRFLSTTGSLPASLAIETTYYVIAVPDADNFEISLTYDGGAIDTSLDSQSGIHTLMKTPAGIDSPTTFLVPDLRGKILIMQDLETGYQLTPANRGNLTNEENGGDNLGSLQNLGIGAGSGLSNINSNIFITV